ncbi:hypothetical protein ACFRNJ_12190 [Streptomyces sp. NPDC056721]|uniref:hypothetical protein n=1 Tax=Streptomyces sp. NPDC056721 TaxID=3345923 RepID=UPI00368F40EF
MNGVSDGRSSSFSTGAFETKYPTVQPIRTKRFTPTSVFDETQVRGSSNGLGSDDYDRRRIGGGTAPSLNGASSQTYDSRLWIDKNPYRTLGG